MPAQTGQTLTFGSALVVSTMAQEQNILLAVASSACTSNPITGSYFMMGLILPLQAVNDSQGGIAPNPVCDPLNKSNETMGIFDHHRIIRAMLVDIY
jgi:hypothetical protein